MYTQWDIKSGKFAPSWFDLQYYTEFKNIGSSEETGIIFLPFFAIFDIKVYNLT